MEDIDNFDMAQEEHLFPTVDSEETTEDFPEAPEDTLTDAEADADTLASAGMGTDEDYGCFDSGDF